MFRGDPSVVESIATTNSKAGMRYFIRQWLLNAPDLLRPEFHEPSKRQVETRERILEQGCTKVQIRPDASLPKGVRAFTLAGPRTG